MTDANRFFLARQIGTVYRVGTGTHYVDTPGSGSPFEVYDSPCSIEALPFNRTLGYKKTRQVDQILVFDPDLGTSVLVEVHQYAHDCDWICRDQLGSGAWPNPPFVRSCQTPASLGTGTGTAVYPYYSLTDKGFYLARQIDVIGTGRNAKELYQSANCTNCSSWCCLRPEQKFPDTLDCTMVYDSGGHGCGDGAVVPLALDVNSIVCNAPGRTCPTRGAVWKGINDPFQVKLRCDYVADQWTIAVLIFDTTPLAWTDPYFTSGSNDRTSGSVSCDPFLVHFTPFFWSQGIRCYDRGTGSSLTGPGASYAEDIVLG